MRNTDDKHSRFLGIKGVVERTDLSRSTIYRQERDGHFPKRRRLTQGRIGWLESEVDQWLKEREIGCGRTPATGGTR